MELSRYHRARQSAYLAWSRLSRGMTLGVRALMLRDRTVVLVRHSYVPGWYLPGGGVDRGETIFDAVHREVREETGAELTIAPRLLSVYRNAHASPRDHVALFLCEDWAERARPPSREIAACEAFPVDALPGDVTPATARRIREVLDGQPTTPDW